MPIYRYTARNRDGKIVQGNQEATNEGAAISLLQNSGLYITQIVNTVAGVKTKAQAKRKRHRGINSEDLLFFIAQTANLLLVGIPFVRALEVIADQTESIGLYKIVQEMIANVKAGSTFKDAMARHPKQFPFYWSFLIEAGELSGTLPEVMSQLAKNLEATENMKKKVVSALVYPCVLISASTGAIIFFMMFIVPIFSNLFKGFGAQLPTLTLMVVRTSDFIKSYFPFLGGGIFLAVVLLQKYFGTPNGRRILHIFLLNAPILGRANNDVIHARICIILSMLIRSGLSFLKCLEITSKVSGNYVFETALSNARLDVQQGKTLSYSLAENELFSPMFVNLVKIGEESGKLPEMVEKASEYFQSRVDVFATRIGVLIEPIVMIFVGGIIGVIAVSLFLPIIKLSSVIK
jgi:type IV pilus assembly protein PilC